MLQPRCPHYGLGWGLDTRLISMLFFFVIVLGKIVNLAVKRSSGLVFYLAWNEIRTTINGKPDTSDISYMIRYRELANSATRQIRLSTNQASLRLLANSRYAIDVRAFKTFIPLVVGPWSDKLTLQTNESGEYWASQGSVSRRSRSIFGSEIEYSNQYLYQGFQLVLSPQDLWRNLFLGRRITRLPELPQASQLFLHFLTKLGDPLKWKTNSGRRTALLAGSGRGFAWSVNLPVNGAWIGKTHEIQSRFGNHHAEWVDVISYSWPPKRQIRK